jgi:PleD family two-component response regulator
LGVATIVPISEHSSEILKITADKALFLAKNAGRNQVIALAPTLEA